MIVEWIRVVWGDKWSVVALVGTLLAWVVLPDNRLPAGLLGVNGVSLALWWLFGYLAKRRGIIPSNR